MSKKRLKLFLLVNVVIAIFESIGLTLATIDNKGETFQYYTQLSNLFLLISSVINVIFAARLMRGKIKEIPRSVNILSYSAICTTTITLLVVLFVLSWMVGNFFWIMFEGARLFTHTLCPLLALAMFWFLSPDNLRKSDAWFALAPTIAYALVAMTMNIISQWYGPYPFLWVYEQPVWASIAWLIGLVGGSYIIARALLVVKNK